MAFKLSIENDGEEFKISLKRNLSSGEIGEIYLVASNVLAQTGKSAELVNQLANTSNESSGYRQTKLGEKSVEAMDFGDYREPEKGVRLKMVAYPTDKIAAATKAFRGIIPTIRMMACKEVVCGNVRCPLLSVDNAMKILEAFKGIEVYAKMVSADLNEEELAA